MCIEFKVTLYTKGFITSTTAPIDTGQSESCRVGVSHWEIAPLHGAR
jgi:hypothetical protein